MNPVIISGLSFSLNQKTSCFCWGYLQCQDKSPTVFFFLVGGAAGEPSSSAYPNSDTRSNQAGILQHVYLKQNLQAKKLEINQKIKQRERLIGETHQ